MNTDVLEVEFTALIVNLKLKLSQTLFQKVTRKFSVTTKLQTIIMSYQMK
jgi:hypothetical protein